MSPACRLRSTRSLLRGMRALRTATSWKPIRPQMPQYLRPYPFLLLSSAHSKAHATKRPHRSLQETARSFRMSWRPRSISMHGSAGWFPKSRVASISKPSAASRTNASSVRRLRWDVRLCAGAIWTRSPSPMRRGSSGRSSWASPSPRALPGGQGFLLSRSTISKAICTPTRSPIPQSLRRWSFRS